MSASAEKPSRASVIAEWVIAEFEADSMMDVMKACAMVCARVAAHAGGTEAEALPVARAIGEDILSLTKAAVRHG